ncbi:MULTISPECIES: hypothetical protein [Klebsiella pneumoniae complex]|uniref:hypothetical protein n=1 Tax=Klebsiella pneumoniae complex TaxID=3390273 RepID=UPI003C12FCD9
MLKKLYFTLPIVAMAGAVVFWLQPHYSAEEESYYRSVFCTIDHNDQEMFLRDMEKLVEGGNSEYALRQYHYIPELGEKCSTPGRSLVSRKKML